MELGAIKTSPQLAGKEEIYFGLREQHFPLASAPLSMLTFGLDYGIEPLQSALRLNRFGRIVLIDWLDEEDVYEARTTTDLSLAYRISPRLTFTLGGTNIFNVYPTQQDTETIDGEGRDQPRRVAARRSAHGAGSSGCSVLNDSGSAPGLVRTAKASTWPSRSRE